VAANGREGQNQESTVQGGEKGPKFGWGKSVNREKGGEGRLSQKGGAGRHEKETCIEKGGKAKEGGETG